MYTLIKCHGNSINGWAVRDNYLFILREGNLLFRVDRERKVIDWFIEQKLNESVKFTIIMELVGFDENKLIGVKSSVAYDVLIKLYPEIGY